MVVATHPKFDRRISAKVKEITQSDWVMSLLELIELLKSDLIFLKFFPGRSDYLQKSTQKTISFVQKISKQFFLPKFRNQFCTPRFHILLGKQAKMSIYALYHRIKQGCVAITMCSKLSLGI